MDPIAFQLDQLNKKLFGLNNSFQALENRLGNIATLLPQISRSLAIEDDNQTMDGPVRSLR